MLGLRVFWGAWLFFLLKPAIFSPCQSGLTDEMPSPSTPNPELSSESWKIAPEVFSEQPNQGRHMMTTHANAGWWWGSSEFVKVTIYPLSLLQIFLQIHSINI